MSDFKGDPRRSTGDGGIAQPSEDDPVVGGAGRGMNLIVVAGVFAILAITLFIFLNSRRNGQVNSLVTPATSERVDAVAPPPLEIAARAPRQASTPVTLPPAPVVAAPAAPLVQDDTMQRLHAPSVVVDLQSGRALNVPAAVMPVSTSSAVAGGLSTKVPLSDAHDTPLPSSSNAPGDLAGAAAMGGVSGLAGAKSMGALSANEQFAARASDDAPEPAVATQMNNLGTTITQGAVIPAVLETAINSDLPGYTRAIVSRDVLGFDGKNILIPRGSSVIGQYRNAVSLGQSRVFIIWSRVIRPDGVTVQIGSPGDDALGRAGLTGDVDSHFFARFGGGILLSILNGGIAAIAGTPSTQISIGSPAAAAGAAASASIPTSADIPPTVSVKQGAAIDIFVARDLDFSAVKSLN